MTPAKTNKYIRTMRSELYEWRPVAGYEGLYEVSEWGVIKRTESIVACGLRNNTSRTVKGHIVKQRKNEKNGYMYVTLSKDGVNKHFRVHRLVAQAFIPNPDNLPFVNHRTECKTFNHFSALEWCDASENRNYGTFNERLTEKMGKDVIQYTVDDKIVKIWPSVCSIEHSLGFSHSNIFKCIKGERKTAYGYKWKYIK